jgi:hypothetical protein
MVKKGKTYFIECEKFAPAPTRRSLIILRTAGQQRGSRQQSGGTARQRRQQTAQRRQQIAGKNVGGTAGRQDVEYPIGGFDTVRTTSASRLAQAPVAQRSSELEALPPDAGSNPAGGILSMHLVCCSSAMMSRRNICSRSCLDMRSLTCLVGKRTPKKKLSSTGRAWTKQQIQQHSHHKSASESGQM